MKFEHHKTIDNGRPFTFGFEVVSHPSRRKASLFPSEQAKLGQIAYGTHFRGEHSPLLRNVDALGLVNGGQITRSDTTFADTAASSSSNNLDEASIKLLVRKIDRRILPILLITFNFNFMDKIIFSNASVYGLTDDVVSGLDTC